MQRIRKSILLQIFAILLILLVFLVGSFIGMNLHEQSVLRETTLQMNETVLDQIDSKVGEYRNVFQRIATTLVYSPTVYDYFRADPMERIISKENLYSVFGNTMHLEANIQGIYLFAENLERLAGMDRETTGYSQESFVPEEIPEDMTFDDMSLWDSTGMPYYLIQFPVYDLDSPTYKTLLGMAVFVMKAEKLKETVSGSRVTEGQELLLLDSLGQVIAKEGKVSGEERDCYVQEKECRNGNWRLVSRIPKRDLWGQSSGTVGLLSLLLGISTLLLAVLFLFCYLNLVRPVRKISQFMEKLKELPERRMDTERKDEIGTVILSMNRMLDELEASSREKQEAARKIYETELAGKQLQILAYQNQINPHFLYNTLDSIRAMALCYEVEDIAEITMALSGLFRFAVKGNPFVSVEEEIGHVMEYGKIIRHRFGGRIRVETEVEPELSGVKIPKLLLQPLVENAVFHGLEQTIKGGTVTVTVTDCGDGNLLLVVADDGCGMSQEAVQKANGIGERKNEEEKQGIGMENIRTRLSLFYGEEAELKVVSEEGRGTSVFVCLLKNRTGEGEHVSGLFGR